MPLWNIVHYIEMDAYPHGTVYSVKIPESIQWELEQRLVLIYLGKSHASSQVHEMVVHALENAGPDCHQLNDLRQTAERSRDALQAGNFARLGRAMIDNTEAQHRLHPALVSADARRVFEIAQAHGAQGWKVNGAGGEGGSLTILCGPDLGEKRSMIRDIERENPSICNIPIALSREGLRVWRQNLLSCDDSADW